MAAIAITPVLHVRFYGMLHAALPWCIGVRFPCEDVVGGSSPLLLGLFVVEGDRGDLEPPTTAIGDS